MRDGYNKLKYFIVLTSILAIPLTPLCLSALATHANNLAESKNKIQNPMGRLVFDREICGKDEKASQKPLLPNGLTLEELSLLVFGKPYATVVKHSGTNDEFRKLAVDKFPGYPEMYIGFGGIKHDNNKSDPSTHAFVSICIFKIISPHKFSVIAHTIKPLQFELIEDGDNNKIGLDELVGIEKRPIILNNDTPTFALRLGANEGYAGGFAYFEKLIIFAVDKTAITEIFDTLVYKLADLAGDWNKDGTRQHEVDETSKELTILPQQVGGYRSIKVGSRSKKKKESLYVWNKSKQRYEISGKK